MPALIAALLVATSPAPAQAPVCNPASNWSYTRIGKGAATVRPEDNAVLLTFMPEKKNPAAEVAFVLNVDAGPSGVYQIDADFDVSHLSEDGLFTLTGAISALPGRVFDVRVVKGDDGFSSFSRPVKTSGQPFQVRLHAKGETTVIVRNVKVCRLR